MKGDKKLNTNAFLCLLILLRVCLTFISMSLKSPGLKPFYYLLLGNELSIANMKTLLIRVRLYVTNVSYRESLLEC